jgi:hypothetical protein
MIQGKRMNIWTAAARQCLFEQLVAKFGPYSEWLSYAENESGNEAPKAEAARFGLGDR